MNTTQATIRSIMNTPQIGMKAKIAKLLLLTVLISFASTAMGGDEDSEKHLKSEIGFLANKLLKMSGKDTYSVEVAPYMKPFIGICTDISKEGLILTCVTPGTQAHKGGLKTGDVVTQIKDFKLDNTDEKKTKRAYYGVVESMQTDDVIPFTLKRGGKTMTLDIKVGAVSHPGYSLKITK